MRQVLIFVLCTIHCICLAQNPPYNPLHSKGKLYEYTSFANTSNSNVSINDIILGEANLEFKPLTLDNESVGFTTDNYWLNFKLENPSNETKIYYLQTARPVTDVANLYQIHNNKISHFKSGDTTPFNERQVQHRKTIFKIELPKNSIQQFYIHLKSDGETLNLPLILHTENQFWKSNYNQQLFLGFFYGLLFLAAIVYLFFYTSLSNKTFLYYSIYVLSIALLQSALDGLIFQYILPSGGFLNNRAVLTAGLFSNFFLLKYCEHFLKIRKRTKYIKVVFKILYTIIIALCILLFINDQTKVWVYPMSNINGMLSLIVILTTLFYLRFKNYKVDVYFTIGIFFLIIGLLGFLMNNLSLLPNNFLTLNSAKFGIALEVIFLSLSMTNLIRDLRLEKEESQVLALNKSEEISELKSYFMSNISHEFRTPINAIMGIADDELSKNQNNEMLKNFQVIKHASLSLLSNINDILDFEKIEKGELKLRNEAFNPKKSIIQISDNWKRMAEKKGLKYNVNIEDTLPEILEGDPERFSQIINNVLSNAVKFTNFGKIDFSVSSTLKTKKTARISIKILDTGVGIKSDQKQNLFNSFGQMRLNNKRSFGGVGLGLSIVKHLVDLYGGTITIDSEFGKGTIVAITLDLKVKQQKSIKEETLKKLSTEVKILVVEDNTMNQIIMKKMLTTLAITNFKVASNGKEAIELLENYNFDIILMDLQMPIMDGYETTSLIRNDVAMHNIKNIPIIAVTADTTDGAREKVKNVGMNDYITKPVNREVLYSKILEQKRSILKIA
ncbi:hybrid sensor histidine kinase/response regulator [Lacinutrix sp. MedPE-SW]|uniref:hybrid sensor histidine kinase/response regulator n=1 Tax=Lacinutrix sp. MedPE-SW TaxID=1860087 RepID=UPI000AA5CCA5|nr:hybrid sensor histidine kinase/response regulator [Lacinutrix sp. MedPE-SW]